MKRSTPFDREKVVSTLRYLEISPKDLPGPVYARLNEGRWIADCPRCRGAEFVTEGVLFLCGSCGSRGEVEWPKDTDKIEAALNVRPRVNQNWLPSETVKMLVAENEEHGF